MKEKKIRYICLSFVLLLLLLGSCYDEPLGLAWYQGETAFTKFFAMIGEVFANLWIFVAGGLLLSSITKEKKWEKILLLPFALFLMMVALLIQTWTFSRFLPNYSILLLFLFTFMLFLIIFQFLLQSMKQVSKKERRHFAFFLLFTCLLTTCLINLLKINIQRPRMRLLIAHPELFFQPWWNLSSTSNIDITALGIAPEEVQSFPSGHASSAALSFLLCYLPTRIENRKQQVFLYLGAFIFTFLVAFSRILCGAHFLSDVSFGILMTLISIFLATRIFYPQQRS